jgi:hypothetical protein
MNWIRRLGYLLLVFALVCTSAWIYGQARWNGLTHELVARLEATRRTPQPSRYDARELDGLPPVVQRYFRATLRDGAPMVAAVTVEPSGSFNLSESGARWLPFGSRQRVVVQRPGFVWDGRVRLAPGIAVHVHDAYLAGEGILHPAIGGVVALGELHDRGGEVARGELMRFLAEAAWYPTALLPSQGVQWDAIDDRSARATLRDGPLRLALTFRFDAQDAIESVRAEARGRTVKGKAVPTPWEGRWSNLQTRDGMRVPLSGEVAWLLPEGRQPYWRGTVTSLAYEFAQ